MLTISYYFKERVEKIGSTVGYHIRLEAKKSSKTRILFLTTGILLRMLMLEGSLAHVSHIFVDEVHERDINTDFLLIVLKQLLEKRQDLRVVLMSATLNAQLFANYFKDFSCALLEIPGLLSLSNSHFSQYLNSVFREGTSSFSFLFRGCSYPLSTNRRLEVPLCLSKPF